MYLLIILVLVLLFAAYVAAKGLFGGPAVLKKTSVVIGGHSFTAEIADTLATRNQGLSDRDSLPEDAAMLFVFPLPSRYGFWMKDMRFSIDIIWIRRGKIIGFKENAVPEPGKSIFSLTSYYPPASVDRVLEVNAGVVEKYGFKVGDPVSIVFTAE